MAHGMLWYAGLVVAGLVELALLLRLVRGLAFGMIDVDVLFWTTWYGGLDITASRRTSPLLYWTAIAGLLVVASGVGVGCAVLALGR